MENTTPTTTKSTSNVASKRFRFDSFAMEFACKEKETFSPPVTDLSISSSSSKQIQTNDVDIVDNDSGIGEHLINHSLNFVFFFLNMIYVVFEYGFGRNIVALYVILTSLG